METFRLKLIIHQKPGLFFKESKSSWSFNSRAVYHFPLKLNTYIYIYVYIYIHIYTHIYKCIYIYIHMFYVAMPTRNCVKYLYSLRRI